MKRPWPVTVIALLFGAVSLLQLWAAIYRLNYQIISLPLWIAIAVGLCAMKSWGRLMCQAYNVVVGTILLFVAASQAFRLIRSMMNVHGQLLHLSPLLLRLSVTLGVAGLFCWIPYFYLRQPKVRQLFD